MSLKHTNFVDFVTLQRGFDLPKSQMKDGEVPVLGSNCIIGYHDVAKADPPGVVTGRSGTLGIVQYTGLAYWPHNTALWVKDFKGNYPKYVYYKLMTLHLENFNGGASVPTLNRNVLDTLPLSIPDYDIQVRIADILSAYDDLIENNQRQIDLLEQSARLLYQEWFVRFRFPGHEHVKIVDGIPEGWSRKQIGDVVEYLNRGITPKYDDEASGIVINQKCIRNRLIVLELARRQSKEVPKDKLVKYGDVLINSTGEGTLGRISQFTYALPNCTVDSHITIARPINTVPRFYFGMFLTSLEAYLSNKGRGATNQTELARSTIAEIAFILPSKWLTDIFEEITSNIYSQIRTLSELSNRLIGARDLLLPRLMNGEIAV